jgi:hypothetical protein
MKLSLHERLTKYDWYVKMISNFTLMEYFVMSVVIISLVMAWL